jgi:hypothetical protein
MYKPYQVCERVSDQIFYYYLSTEEEALQLISEFKEVWTFYSATYAPVIKVYQIDGFKNV